MPVSKTRTIIKHNYLKTGSPGKTKAKAHLRYIVHRPAADKSREAKPVFNAKSDNIAARSVLQELDNLKHSGVLIHKLIISPGRNDLDMAEFTKELMKRLGEKKGLDLKYWGVVHDNTEKLHSHVIICGKDLNGAKVRIDKSDYVFLREQGDDIALALVEPERVIEAPGRKAVSVLSMLAAFGLPIKRERTSDLVVVDKNKSESMSLGEMPTTLDLIKKSKERETREKLKQEREIVFYDGTFPTVLNSRTPKEELDEVINDYEKGRRKDQIRRFELTLLRNWRDNWTQWEENAAKVEKKTWWKSRQVHWIDLASNSAESKTFSKDSKLAELEGLLKKNEEGSVVLTAAEEKALKSWVGEKRRELPIEIETVNGLRLSCQPTDDLKDLEKVAIRHKEGLSEEEYKKLWSWIFKKRFSNEIDRPIELNSPLGKIRLNRSDSKEELQFLMNKYRSKESWVVEQLDKNEVNRLSYWLKEKSEREPRI